MFLENIYLAGYAIAWITLTALYIIRTKGVGLGGMLLITYSLSALMSIVFFGGMGAFLTEGADISWQPLLYLFLTINICLFPILRHSKDLRSIPFRDNGKGVRFLKYFILICSPFIIEAFLEMGMIAVSTSTSSLGGIYESEGDVVGDKLSFFGRKTMAIVRWFTYVWPILFFYFLNKGKQGKKSMWLSFLACFCVVLEAYAGASRLAIVRYLMYMFIIFVLFRVNMAKELQHKIINLFIFIGGFLIVLLSLITISRFAMGGGGDNNDIWTWIALYIGESPIRFCQYLWDVKATMQGDNSFALFKNLLGMDTITDLEERREYYELHLGIPNRIFYSFIGDFFFDLGKYLTLIFTFLFSFSLDHYIRNILKRGYYTMPSLLILAMIILVLEFGIMYFCFKLYIVQILLIPNFILVYLYSLQKKM